MEHELPDDKKLSGPNVNYDWKTRLLTVELPRQVSKFTVICEPIAPGFLPIHESWRIPPDTSPVTSVQVPLTQLHPETGYKFILKDGDELLGWFKKYKLRRSKSNGEQVTSLPTTPQANASPAAGPAAPPLEPRAAREPTEKKRVNNDAAQEAQLPRKAQMTTKARTFGTAPSVPALPPKAAPLVVAPPAPVPPGLAAVPSSPEATAPDPEPEAPAAAPLVPAAAHAPILALANLKLELKAIASAAGSLGWHWYRPNSMPDGATYEWNLLRNKQAIKSGTTTETYATFVASVERLECEKQYAFRMRVKLHNGDVGTWVTSRYRKMKEFARDAVIPEVRRAMWAAFYPGKNGESSMIKHDCLGCRAQGYADAQIAKLDPLLSNVHAGHIISHARGGPDGTSVDQVWDFMPLCEQCNKSMSTKNAIQWFYDKCSRRNNDFEVLYEVLWRLRDACQRRDGCPPDILNETNIAKFAVKMYHEGHEHYEEGRDHDGEFPWKKLGGGFSLEDNGAFKTAFKNKPGNQGRTHVESADVTASLAEAILGLGSRVSEIENRITNERRIEEIMSQATMRLVEANVNPNAIGEALSRIYPSE